MKNGIGFDVHAFGEGRKLILGGVDVPYNKGLAGHSDSDVLIHAIMDAILGACGIGDIGIHFPDNDMRYKDISSLKLLGEVRKKMEAGGFSIGNIDTVLILQEPKVFSYFDGMKKNIAHALGINPKMVNIKATTTEHLGFCGRGEGIAAQAIVLLNQ
jgi:2-C-methyl-D-erythritol 2,4-cyclodiphosphate synthase